MPLFQLSALLSACIAEATNRAIGLSRSRPLISFILSIASGISGSQAIPYTVSVGTTIPPARSIEQASPVVVAGVYRI